MQPQAPVISLRTTMAHSTNRLHSNAFAIVLAMPAAIAVDEHLSITRKPIQGQLLDEVAIKAILVAPVLPATVSILAVPGPVSALAADLMALVAVNSAGDPLDSEAACLATAVYFEARGETLDGQLAVAQVVMNRAESGRYPTTWCAVVKQRAQFSFVRSGGRFPAIKPGCLQWVRAQAIARIATKRLAPSLSPDVLWYHANYVAPSWGRRLNRVSQIGSHIFYRS